MTILPPVRPYRGRRGNDPAGSGVFGASRDGGARKHNGLDLLSVPGDEVVSPIFGVMTHVGRAYPDSDLGSIHLKGYGQHEGAVIKLLYVAPSVQPGDVLKAGDPIGKAQDVAAYHAEKGHAGMKNHVHMELTLLVDPGQYLPMLSVDPSLVA